MERDFSCELAELFVLSLLGWIRIVAGLSTGKVVAKLNNSLVFSCGYRCYENHQSSCRLFRFCSYLIRLFYYLTVFCRSTRSVEIEAL